MIENTPSYDLKAERKREKKVVDQAVKIAQPLLSKSHLLNTEFPIDQQDVQIVQQVLQTVFPIDSQNYKVHDHLQLAAEFGGILAQKIGLNPNEIKVLMLSHDDGRFITHRWFRNELLAGSMFNKLNIRPDLIQKANIPMAKPDQSVDDFLKNISDDQKVMIMADICGKRKYDDGGILTFDEVMAYHLTQRKREKQDSFENKKDTFPSQRKTSDEFIEFYAEVYKSIKNWFNHKGIDVETIRQDILINNHK